MADFKAFWQRFKSGENGGKGQKVDMSRFPINMENYANTSAASIPILLDELVQTGRLRKGQKILLAGFGAGLTWAGSILEW